MPHETILQALRDLLTALPENMVIINVQPLKPNRRKELRETIATTIKRLELLAEKLDPVQRPALVFDPADPEIVGKLIGDTLLEQPRGTLPTPQKFYGSGVYAIYYTGNFPAYSAISGTDTPIYVGKADPASLDARSPVEQGEKLYGRLKEHSKSIEKAEAHGDAFKAKTYIQLRDFECRYLVVRSAWQRTAEDYLIGRFKPIWNDEVKICYGFGKHGDSSDTRKNTRSPWDTVHPGRQWATHDGNQPNPLSADQIIQRIQEHFERNQPIARSTQAPKP